METRTQARPMILMIDNYDSFTYNIYQMLAEQGFGVEVVRNDELTQEDGIRPSQEGTPLSKDVWLAAIGASLIAQGKK